VWVSSGFGTEKLGGVVGYRSPVVEERPRAVVEEHVANVVRRAVPAVEDLRVYGAAQGVGGQIVPASVAHERHPFGERVEGALHVGRIRPGDAATCGAAPGLARSNR